MCNKLGEMWTVGNVIYKKKIVTVVQTKPLSSCKSALRHQIHMLNNECDCNKKLQSAVHCIPVRCKTSIDFIVIYDVFRKLLTLLASKFTM